MITSNTNYNENWLAQITDVISNPIELLNLLNINTNSSNYLISNYNIKSKFPMKIPRTFISRMEKGNLNDPLLIQVLTTKNENIVTPGFSKDPLKEHNKIIIPGLLHKYLNRVLFLVKGNCAINCRYCFRRYFPRRNYSNKRNWQLVLNYIASKLEIDEVIFSGGDPLVAKDHELEWLINSLDSMMHIKRLRIHSRIPVIIPARINNTLISIFKKSRLQILLVNHINHANEISSYFCKVMKYLQRANVILLNQSVLLRGVNDNAQTLAELSKALIDMHIMPYYLHILDKVQGTSHFMVSDEEARTIMRELTKIVSGYMIPKLVKENEGNFAKIYY